MPLLVFKETGLFPDLPGPAAEENHIPHGEGTRKRRAPPISRGNQQSAGPFADVAARGAGQQQAQRGRSIEHVGNVPQPLCWRHLHMVAKASGRQSVSKPVSRCKLVTFRRSAAFY